MKQLLVFVFLLTSVMFVIPVDAVPDPPKFVNATFSTSPPYSFTTNLTEPDGNGAAVSHYNFLNFDINNILQSLTNQTGTSYSDTSPIQNSTAMYRVFANNTAGWSHDYAFPMNQTISDNLVLHFPFGESVNDNGLLENDGVVTGTEQYDTTSHNGYSFDFDGASYVTLPNESDYDFERTDPMSISFWIEANSQNNVNLISKRTDNGSVGYSVWLQTSFLNFDMNGATTELRTRATSTSITDGTPHHVMIVYQGDSDADNVSIYFDGVDQTESVVLDNLSQTILNNESLVIGAESDGGQPFTGSLDEVMIFDVALDANEVSQIYNERITTIDTISRTFTNLQTGVVGDVLNFNGTITVTQGFPLPVVDTMSITANSTRVVTNSSDFVTDYSTPIEYNLWWLIPNSDVVYDVDLQSDIIRPFTPSSNDTTITGSSNFIISEEYEPDYFPAIVTSQGNVNYTLTRSPDQDTVTLKANRDKNGQTFNMECFTQTLAQVQTGNASGTWVNKTNVGYYNSTLDGFANTHVYGNCYNDALLFSFTSYTNSSLAFLGLAAFDDIYGSFLGVPVGVFFVVIMAGMATQRTASTWIIIILAVIGVMTSIGIFGLEDSVWSLMLIMAALAVLVGRKFI